MLRQAVLTVDRIYRYSLIRVWDEELPLVTFILLNPSTADEMKDDPTLRRGIDFARRWGFGQLAFVNLFAFRATDPKDLLVAKDPIGPYNDAHIVAWCDAATRIVCAWGNNGTHRNRDQRVIHLLREREFELFCLGTTKGGHPKHPVRLAKTTPLQTF